MTGPFTSEAQNYHLTAVAHGGLREPGNPEIGVNFEMPIRKPKPQSLATFGTATLENVVSLEITKACVAVALACDVMVFLVG